MIKKLPVFILALTVLSGVAFLPALAVGQTNPLPEGIVPRCTDGVCHFNDLLKLIGNIFTFLVRVIAVPVAVLSITYAGWLYISKPTDLSARSKARDILLAAVVGLAITLASWLIVRTIIVALTGDEASPYLRFFGS